MSCYGRCGGGEPYPSADNIRPAKKMARALCDSFTGELSTINSYIYYSVIFSDTMPALADTFAELSMTEMIHFRLLSQCIKCLGGNPAISLRLSTEAINGGFCQAPREVGKVIERSICDETAAYEEYRRLAECTCDAALRSVLDRLAEDEREHRKILEGLWV